MSLTISGALSKEHRDALPASDFAVPGKRALPMHDETHVRMAWNMVDKTKGLSPEERSSAKKKIVRRAHKLGIDTSDWNIHAEDANDVDPRVDDHDEDDNLVPNEVKAEAVIIFSGMSLDVPDVKDHPNKVPFSGVLTRLDEPSNNPLSGSMGKRVVLPKDVAEKALPSLLGMAIDFNTELDGHDVKSKIGFITEATIQGNAVHIGGYFYGADFPDEVKHIQAEKASLGFSYEAQAQVRSMNDDPLVVKSCVFTGAAVLYKNKAAYTTTSLSAKMEKEKMNEDKLLQMIEGLTAKIDKLEAAHAEKGEEQKLAAGNIQHLIKPHAEALRNCAASMAAAGIGMHPKAGHVATLHNMADHMESEAALGKMPHIYYTNDFLHASNERKSDEPSKEVAELKAGIDAISSKLVDIEKANFQAASSPERKTLSPSILALLNKVGLKASGSEKMTVESIDGILSNSKVSTANKIAIKLALRESGNL